MDCANARIHLLDRRRGALAASQRSELEAHMASCDACLREDAADAELTTLLERELPRLRAPEGLRRRLQGRLGLNKAPARASVWAGGFLGLAAGAALAALVVLVLHVRPPAPNSGVMVAEAVNDHLRVLYSDRPLEVQSGGIHQVKPWFEGRVDFAPVVGFAGDDDFPLQGGAVAYFIDRKAAAFVFKRRLHLITLFVFPAQGLPWPPADQTVGPARATLSTSRGFHTLLWTQADLGYALVSDVAPADLTALAVRIASGHP